MSHRPTTSFNPFEYGIRECTHSGCNAQLQNHRWTKHGWFLQRNGDSWCPDHIPDWVASWREKRRSK